MKDFFCGEDEKKDIDSKLIGGKNQEIQRLIKIMPKVF